MLSDISERNFLFTFVDDDVMMFLSCHRRAALTGRKTIEFRGRVGTSLPTLPSPDDAGMKTSFLQSEPQTALASQDHVVPSGSLRVSVSTEMSARDERSQTI
jgi:hypothetical protein